LPTFNQGEVIKVPFHYTDRATRRSRPALVVSSGIAMIEAADAVRLDRLAAAPLRRAIEHIVKELSGSGE
jgi:hypothetical protein